MDFLLFLQEFLALDSLLFPTGLLFLLQFLDLELEVDVLAVDFAVFSLLFFESLRELFDLLLPFLELFFELLPLRTTLPGLVFLLELQLLYLLLLFLQVFGQLDFVAVYLLVLFEKTSKFFS